MHFVDTNVLLYALSTAVEEAGKRERARALLDREDLAFSVQVLQEFYVQATRPTRADPLSHEQTVNLIESWLRYPVQAITVDIHLAALSARLRWALSYWDAAIVEAARALGCRVILTEDLQHGMNFAGIHAENPFR